MSDRVDAFEIGGRQLSDIPIDSPNPTVFVAPKGAVFVELSVDADDFVTSRLQSIDEGAADVAAMPRYQDPHLFTPMFSREPCPGSITPRATACRAVYPCTANTNRGDRRRADRWPQALPWVPAPNWYRRRRYIRRRPAPARKKHH